MEFVSIRDFTTATKDTQEKLDKDGKIVLTNHGKPTALVLKVDSDNFEDTLETIKVIEYERMVARKLAEADKELNNPDVKRILMNEAIEGIKQKYAL